MELRVYLGVLLRKWWIVLFAFLITYGATLAFTFSQKPVYEATATYVLTLGPAFKNNKDAASNLDILSRRTEIATTYSTLATSHLIKKQAADALSLPEQQRSDLSVSSRLIAGTNVLQISVQGSNPALAREFANAIGDKTIAYVRKLYETYELQLLDKAGLPNKPIKPNKLLNLTLGAVMGLILGIGLAFLAAYLQAPPEHVTNFGVLDEESGAYNKQYFTQRLRQELSRAKRSNRPIALALMDIDHRGAMDKLSSQIRREAIRKEVGLLQQHLRDEDVMALAGDTVFAFLLPDMSGAMAKDAIERLQTLISTTPVELERSGVKLDLQSSAGVVAYPDVAPDSNLTADDLLEQATQALKQAEMATYSKICLVPAAEEQLDIANIRSALSAR